MVTKVLDLPVLQAVADPRVMRLIVLPTEQCNFRCTYCYEDFKIGRMSSALVDALKAWIISRADDVEQMTLSWFGGEPTLALPIVLDVSATARDAFRQPGKSFFGGMTTNGYKLTKPVFQSLVAVGVTDFQITLDGPAEIHDSRRLRIDGAPTFSVLWQNLVDISSSVTTVETPFHVGLRIHYDRKTAYYLGPLIDQIKRQLLPCGRFSVQFHEIEKLGGPNDQGIDLATSREHAVVREWVDDLQKGMETYQAHVAQDVKDYVCYAAKANAFVVRADGRLGKCTVALNDPRNDVGRLNLDGTVTWFDGRLDPWLRGLISGDPQNLACPLDGMTGEIPVQLRRTK